MSIKVEQLDYRANGNLVLRVQEMSLRRGECVVLTGENGSGKSTLLRILAGLLCPQTGTFTFDTRPLSFPAARPHLLASTVYVHQTPYMFDGTVATNLRYGLRFAGVSRKVAEQRLDRALEWSGLDALRERNARLISGGERQRLALARAQILEPDYLLLDEPTSGLDSASRERALQLIAELTEGGAGVLVTSHDPDRILAIGDRHLVLKDGKLLPQHDL